MKRQILGLAVAASILGLHAMLTPIVTAGQAQAATQQTASQAAKTAGDGGKNVSTSAKATSAQKPATQVPKTPWGDPDLQGTWDSTFSFDWGSTFERDPKYGGRAELTDQEFAERQKQAAQAEKTDSDAIPAGGGGTAPASKTGAAWLGGGYNAWWLEQGKVNRQTSQVVNPPDGRLPPRTAAAQNAANVRRKPRLAASWEDLTLWERCLTKGGMPNIMFPRGYNNNTEIVQTPGYVALMHEMIHETRIIPLDGRPHLPNDVRQWLGDPRGHWEGNTLVVDTTNIDPRVSALQPWANMNSRSTNQQRLHTVERFTRISPEQISYQIVVDDPEMYTRPWTVSLPMVKTNERIFEYACHEGNYTMTDVLSGARQEEKDEASGKKKPPSNPNAPVAPPE